MKTVVVELDEYSLKYENTLAVARAFVERGIDVKMWNPATTSLLDMVHSAKPSLIFYASEVNATRRGRNIAREQNPGLRFFNTEVFENMVVADTLAFKRINPHPLFSGEVCILQYPEVESPEDLVLKTKMSIKNTERFRLFSIKSAAGGKSCGWIPKEMHPLIFSSANSVLALSKHTAVNALLCNDNVKLSNGTSVADFKMTPEEIDAISNVTISKTYIGE